MANKLKNVFSDEMPSLDGRINFPTTEAYRKFMEALKAVWENGETVTLEGNVEIETAFQSGAGVYPTDAPKKVKDLTIGPSKEEVSFEVETEYGRKVLAFERFATNDSVVLETAGEPIVYIKLTLGRTDGKFRFTYCTHPERAESVRELLESYSGMLAFLERLFGQGGEETAGIAEEETDAVANVKAYFVNACMLHKKLEYVEQTFGISFEPAKLTRDRESQMDLEELYLVLKEGKVIRLNAKLTETDATGIVVKRQDKMMKIGSVLDITFISNVEYALWGHKVELYSANLLSNAIVKEIIEGENGEMRILYGNEDSNPMYISYRAFRTEAEAREEMQRIMEYKDIYAGALTVQEYISHSVKNL